MASEKVRILKQKLQAQIENENRLRTGAPSRKVPCGCPPGYNLSSRARFDDPSSFPINQSPGCPSPLGGAYEARALAGFRRNAGQVKGGLDQRISAQVVVAADAATKDIDTGLIELPSTGGVISKVAGMKIMKLSVNVNASGAPGNAAFIRNDFFNNAIMVVRQGDTLLYENSLFKFEVTEFSRLGFDVEIDPEPADFAGVTFQITGSVNTDEANNYNLDFTIIPQWA